MNINLQLPNLYLYFKRINEFKTANLILFGGNRRSPSAGTSIQPFLELQRLLFWIWDTHGFPWIATLDGHPSMYQPIIMVA